MRPGGVLFFSCRYVVEVVFEESGVYEQKE